MLSNRSFWHTQFTDLASDCNISINVILGMYYKKLFSFQRKPFGTNVCLLFGNCTKSQNERTWLNCKCVGVFHGICDHSNKTRSYMMVGFCVTEHSKVFETCCWSESTEQCFDQHVCIRLESLVLFIILFATRLHKQSIRTIKLYNVVRWSLNKKQMVRNAVQKTNLSHRLGFWWCSGFWYVFYALGTISMTFDALETRVEFDDLSWSPWVGGPGLRQFTQGCRPYLLLGFN